MVIERQDTHTQHCPLKGATILITGGTGSFGNRIATTLLDFEPAAIRIYSRDEKKQWEMQRLFPQLHYVIGDVRDPQRLNEAMQGVDYVFHAAALKQVPSCETYPFEAVKTNVLGSQNACAAAIANGVKVFVGLSTDKAVKAVNAMGMTKALMEKIVCSQNQRRIETRFCCVRYGNVMGSRGSVIPVFRQQIESDQPLFITAPDMTRFLLTLDQSVSLVLHAMMHSQGGEIFVQKAPACTVRTLANAMCAKYSRVGSAHPITIGGIRPGEKVHEILVNEYEMRRSIETDDHFCIYPEYKSRVPTVSRELGEEYTSANTRQLTETAEIGELLDSIGQVEYFT